MKEGLGQICQLRNAIGHYDEGVPELQDPDWVFQRLRVAALRQPRRRAPRWRVGRNCSALTVESPVVAANLLHLGRASPWRSTIRGAGAMPDHKERPPNALAHGAAKSSDIERVRRDVDQAEVRVTHDDQASTARRRRQLRSREAERKSGAQR
jgi:hypothetical protein